MSKRPAALVAENGSTLPTKRLKLEQRDRTPAKAQDVLSSRHLQQLLSFQQDAGLLKNGIQSLKMFLESIARSEDESAKSTRLAILKEYLDRYKPRADGDEQNIYLSDVMQTWSFAGQSNNDSLLSAVPAVLALLLKTISTLIDFRDYGIRLCKTALQQAQLKLISRSLASPKSKEYIISPCLRLLTEVVSFDGGALAKLLYARRDLTFNNRDLVRNLGLRRALSGDPEEDRRKPSVRYNTLRYILANFRYQDQDAKSDILGQSNLVRAIFEDIKQDSTENIVETINVVRKHIILDGALPRSSKSRLLTDRNLGRLATLYSFEESSALPLDQVESVQVLTHRFLLSVCTSTEAGILVPQSGWYPPGIEKENVEPDKSPEADLIDLGLDSIEWYAKFRDKVPVRNTILSNFAQNLRPYANTMQSELLLKIFDAAPELVADYFFRKKNFTFDPKLTATWMGYCAFLFSSVQLPVLKFGGRKEGFGRTPPPVSVVIESILPQPLNQKALSRCLNQNACLVTFFTVRLLTVSFHKLQSVLSSFGSAPDEEKVLWVEASTQLRKEFCRRCPKMKDIILAYRRTSEENALQREAVTRLLATYYKIIPQVALEERFDVSIALASSLRRFEGGYALNEDSGLRLLELEHLLLIAEHSPIMRWWQKPESLGLSPFITILKILVDAPHEAPLGQIRKLLHSIVCEQNMLQQITAESSLDALLVSLRKHDEWTPSRTTFEFVDNAMSSYVKKSVKYHDDLEFLVDTRGADGSEPDHPISLLHMTLMEQWPIWASSDKKDIQSIAEWLARYLTYSVHIGEAPRTISIIRGNLVEASDDGSYRKALKQQNQSGFKKASAALVSATPAEGSLDPKSLAVEPATPAEDDEPNIGEPPAEDPEHNGLTRWMQKDIDEAVVDGDVGELIMCLCSEHPDIRKQAFIGIQKLHAKASTNAERQQIYVLLGELVETARDIIDTRRSPSFIGAFASRALLIVADPLHTLYPKMNRFLNKGPLWTVEKVPSYWVDKILLQPPDEDDAHYKEVEWLLDFLIDGLRTSEDMSTYRVRNVFERFLSLYCSPFLPRVIKKKTIDLVFRATCVEGSTTLITRSGIISWIEAQLSLKDTNNVMLKRLVKRLFATSDWTRVEAWSGGMSEKIAHITES
ncbi:MAG: hypothetical protein M1827_002261 [Pycnora praestabilis]|nr:MAG: hypothetical protein M1827_002261 [Pycnora praestabilis]